MPIVPCILCWSILSKFSLSFFLKVDYGLKRKGGRGENADVVDFGKIKNDSGWQMSDPEEGEGVDAAAGQTESAFAVMRTAIGILMNL